MLNKQTILFFPFSLDSFFSLLLVDVIISKSFTLLYQTNRLLTLCSQELLESSYELSDEISYDKILNFLDSELNEVSFSSAKDFQRITKFVKSFQKITKTFNQKIEREDFFSTLTMNSFNFIVNQLEINFSFHNELNVLLKIKKLVDET